MKIRKAIIPAAGQGTRLLPLTISQPKEMLPVGRKPVIQHVVDEIRLAGVEHTLIITNKSKKAIEDYFDTSDPVPGEIFYMHQIVDRPDLNLPYGLAYAIGLSEGFVNNETFIVCLGDCIMKSNSSNLLLKRMIQTHEMHNAAATIAFEEVPLEKVCKYGIASPLSAVGDEFQLGDIVEKPCPKKSPSNLAVAARYIFEPEIFSYIRQTPEGHGGEIQITDAIRLLLKDGRNVWGVKLQENEARYDIGGFAGYFKAFCDFALLDEEVGEEFRQYIVEQ